MCAVAWRGVPCRVCVCVWKCCALCFACDDTYIFCFSFERRRETLHGLRLGYGAENVLSTRVLAAHTRTQAQHEQITNNTQCIYVLIADLTVGGWYHSNAWAYFVMSAFDKDFATTQWVERCGHTCFEAKNKLSCRICTAEKNKNRKKWIMWHARLNGSPKLFQCKIFIYQILQIDLCPGSTVQ